MWLLTAFAEKTVRIEPCSVTSDSELTLCTDYVTTTFQNGRKVTSLPRKRNHTL